MDNVVNLVADLGNSLLKTVSAEKIGATDVIPHAVWLPNDASYKSRVTRAKYHANVTQRTALFEAVYKSGTQPVIVGVEAIESGQSKRVTGAEKYRAGYFDVLVKAMLLRRLPNGHDNIRLAIAHPPDAIPYLDTLMDIVGGVHRVRALDGKVVKYVVREVVPFDEPAGGLWRFMAVSHQGYNPHSFTEGMRLLVIDIGGKVSSMTTVLIGHQMALEPQYGSKTSPVFNLGIQDVSATLHEELKSLYPDIFQPMKDIPQDMLDTALREGRILIANQPVNVEQAVLNAVAPILDAVSGIYNSQMSGGRIFNHIVVSGGGGGLLMPFLVNEVLNHSFVHLADQKEFIHLANVRGGAVAFQQWLKAK